MKALVLLLATTSLYAGYFIYNNYYRKDADFRLGVISIMSDNGSERVQYKVKIAEDYKSREMGLMYVHEMPADEGMIFIYDDESRRYMWMKNTFIPLDMLFVSSDMKVVSFKENATPFSEDLISSVVPVKYTIELNAGQIEKNGIKVGDKIEFNRL